MQTIQPYSLLPAMYDQVVGDPWFPQIRATFEAAVRHYSIRFSSAADIGCGTGTFARYLSDYGVPVFAVDRSKAMLAIAAEKNRGRNVTLLRQDIRKFQLPQAVDLITCNHDTLNYMLTNTDLRRVFRRCNEHLSLDGYLIFDIIVALQDEQSRRGARQRLNIPCSCVAAEGSLLKTPAQSVWNSVWNPQTRLNTVQIRFLVRRHGENKQLHELHVQRWHSLPAIRALVARSGLQLRGVHDAEDFGPVSPATSWVKCVAQKKR